MQKIHIDSQLKFCLTPRSPNSCTDECTGWLSEFEGSWLCLTVSQKLSLTSKCGNTLALCQVSVQLSANLGVDISTCHKSTQSSVLLLAARQVTTFSKPSAGAHTGHSHSTKWQLQYATYSCCMPNLFPRGQTSSV